MNTPDQGPKDGDFVAYVAELERRQLLANPPATHASANASMNRSTSSTVATPHIALNTAALAAAAGTVKTLPVGLIVVGLVLVIAGALFQGGFVAILIGVALLWQAARVVLRNAKAVVEVSKPQAVQQVANALAAHVQRKNSTK